MRLVGGTTPNNGRVEVYRNGYWGTICSKGWDIPDASVVCRMLGYLGAWTADCCTEYRGGTGPVWLSELSCTGREKSLSECGHSDWGVNNCDHSKDAEVICHSPPTEKPLQQSTVITPQVLRSSTPTLTVLTSTIQTQLSPLTLTVQVPSTPSTTTVSLKVASSSAVVPTSSVSVSPSIIPTLPPGK